MFQNSSCIYSNFEKITENSTLYSAFLLENGSSYIDTEILLMISYKGVPKK